MSKNIVDGMLESIAAAEGFCSVDELLENSVTDSVVSGACHNCGHVETSCEPDARENWCGNCEENMVESCLSLAGLI